MSLTRKQRANILLLDRSQNWSSTRSTTSHRATPLPDNSPFNRFIKPNHRQNYPIQTTIKGMTFASKDGMFTNSCAYTGRGALWEYSKGARQNVIKDEPVNPIIIKADMLSIQELEAMNSQDDKYIREAKLFIPIIMKKLEDYRQRKANGENIDPSKVLTESEKVYLRTMNPQSPEFRNIVLQLTKSGILAGILGIVGASPAAVASAATSGTPNPASIIPTTPAPQTILSGGPTTPTTPVPVGPSTGPGTTESNFLTFVASVRGDDEKEVGKKADVYYKPIETRRSKLKKEMRILAKVLTHTTDPKEQELLRWILLGTLNPMYSALPAPANRPVGPPPTPPPPTPRPPPPPAP